jgi:SAM-dependent methyltransferase
MNQPAWKKFLSYFVDIQLELGASDLNPSLELCLRKGRYCLTTPNAIYSYADLYDNFTRTFRKIDLDRLTIADVLVLGFGLGSIPYMLEKVFNKNYRYVGVERDEVIALWASQYVLPELKSPVELQLADAWMFVDSCSEKFDLIVMDIFVDDVIPEEFEEMDFLETLKDLLNENGLLLYNRLAAQPGDRRLTEIFFQNTFKKVFPQATYLDVMGNWMLKNY